MGQKIEIFHSTTLVAMNITRGIVATERRVEVPTPCAENPGAVSYSSANILVAVAAGIPETAVMKSTQKSENPSILSVKQKKSGIARSLNMQR